MKSAGRWSSRYVNPPGTALFAACGEREPKANRRCSPVAHAGARRQPTSNRYTIFDVFAADRMGLLYTIARSLFQSGLSVAVAKIGTYLDQVVDVFYVTDQAGQKVCRRGAIERDP